MAEAFLDRLESEIPQMRRYARALTRIDDQADDLVQECLERAIRRQNQFEQGSNLRSWLFTIMHNMQIDHWRKAQRRGTSVTLEDWYSETARPPSQDKAAELTDVGRAITALNHQERQVVELIGVNGWKYREVADHLQIAVGTVKSRLSRARSHLRELLGESAPTNP